MTPVRLAPESDWTGMLALLRSAFAYMDGRIDPPSSLHRLTPADLDMSAETGEIWIIGKDTAPDACMVLTPQPTVLYLGKLAVCLDRRGTGLARHMVDLAATRAAQRGLDRLQLQTRIELTENHATFARLGFIEVRRTPHPGYDRPTSIVMERAV